MADFNAQQQHIKSFSASKNSIRFQSAKNLLSSSKISADVYRKRQNPDEVRVHDSTKRFKRTHKKEEIGKEDGEDDTNKLTILASELNTTLERNASDIFSECYNAVYPKCQSLPEILHNKSKICEILLDYLLITGDSGDLTIHHASEDVLHLISVFAKELRHEIHSEIYILLDFIITKLISIPSLNLRTLQTSFRTVGFLVQYDPDNQVEELRKRYYGVILGHTREAVRKLGAECFSAPIRRSGAKETKKHVKKVLRGVVLAIGKVEGSATLGDKRKKKMRSDVVDGVSRMLVYAAKGVGGRLHSKASQEILTVLLDLVVNEKTEEGREVMEEIISPIFKELCACLKKEHFAPIWETLFDSLERATTEVANDNISCEALLTNISLLDMCVSYQTGLFLSDKVVKENITTIISKLLLQLPFQTIRKHSLKLLCSSWKVNPEGTNGYASILSEILPASRKTDSLSVLLLDLIPNLLPHLPISISQRTLVPMFFGFASDISADFPDKALEVLHATISSFPPCAEDDFVTIFYTEFAKECTAITSSHLQSLLELCCSFTAEMSQTKMSLSVQCIPFLIVCCDACELSQKKVIHKTWRWFLSQLNYVNTQEGEEKINSMSLLLAALSMSILGTDPVSSSEKAKECMQKVLPHSRTLLCSPSFSITTLYALSCYAKTLQKTELSSLLSTSDDSADLFEQLTPQLRDPNCFRRKYALDILAALPEKHFLVNHANLDFQDDMDEEGTGATAISSSSGTDPNPGKKNTGGACSLLSALVDFHSLPLSLKTERQLSYALSTIELLSKNPNLPPEYTDVIANSMLGCFHIKFAPVWKGAIRVLTSLVKNVDSTNQSNGVWVCLWGKLRDVADTNINAKSKEGTMNEQQDQSLTTSSLTNPTLQNVWNNHSSTVNIVNTHGAISRLSTTDSIIVFQSILSVLENLPQVSTRKNRQIVSFFLQFLQMQYFENQVNVHPDAREWDLETHLTEIEGNSDNPFANTIGNRKHSMMKLTSFLQLFAAISGPKQLYKHQLLLQIHTSLLSHASTDIAQLALDCVLRYKLPHVNPYSETLKRMLKEKEWRTVMTKFYITDPTSSKLGDDDEGVVIVESRHREPLLPLVVRILFGRMSSKAGCSKRKSKDSPTARRGVALAFLSQLGLDHPRKYVPLVYQMVRMYAPAPKAVKVEENVDIEDEYDRMSSIIQSVHGHSGDAVSHLGLQRHVGFLNLLGDVFFKLGYGVESYVGVFMTILLKICAYTEEHRKSATNSTTDEEKMDEDEEDESQLEAVAATPHSRMGALRSLCHRRLSDLLRKFASSSFDFTPFVKPFWTILFPAVETLPQTILGQSKPPSSIILLETLSAHPKLISSFLVEKEEAVGAVLECVDGSEGGVRNCVWTIVENLLSEGKIQHESVTVETTNGVGLVEKYLHLLLSRFTQQMGGSCAASGETDARALAKRELAILCQVSPLLLDDKKSNDDQAIEMMETLFSLLLPYLQLDRKPKEYIQLDVLGILTGLIPKMRPAVAISHVSSLSRLLGPYKSDGGTKLPKIRLKILEIMAVIATVAEEEEGAGLKNVVEAVMNLNAMEKGRMEDMDFETILPVWNTLGREEGWLAFSRVVEEGKESSPLAGTKVLTPLVYHSLHSLYDSDGVIARGSFQAVKTFIHLASQHAKTSQSQDNKSNSWVKLMETTVSPCIRAGLNSHTDSIRRNFILLIAEMSKYFQDFSSSPHLYGDLNVLQREDDPDLDFFLNITHVQVHRRGRALTRLGKLLLESKDQQDVATFTQTSLTNVMLPIAMHPIYECRGKSKPVEENYALEAVVTVGVIAGQLSWPKYQNVLANALSSFSRYPDQERYVIGMICAVIDAFHFEVIPPLASSQSAQGGPAAVKSPSPDSNEPEVAEEQKSNAVWRALHKRLIPKIESLLTKKVKGRGNHKASKTIRSPVVLALLKLLQKTPKEMLEAKLPRLILVICDALKNYESDVRDLARDTMAKMAADLDICHLPLIVRELAGSLTEGYQLHVRSSTLHSIFTAVSKVYTIPTMTSPEDAASSPVDRCVPAIMDLIQQDIFGRASEMKEVEGVRRRVIKEAMGVRSFETLEILCRMILVRPSLVSGEVSSSSLSSVHNVVIPLLQRLRLPDVDQSTMGKIRECLNRVVVGISYNDSAKAKEIMPFVYSSVAPFIFEGATKNTSQESDGESDEDEDPTKRIKVSGSKGKKGGLTKDGKKIKTDASRLVKWQPSTLHAPKDGKSALSMKKRDKAKLHKVHDGASAPKLTGHGRHGTLKSSASSKINDPASVNAVVFGISLLHSCLKRSKLDKKDTVIRSMADPFVSLLIECVSSCGNKDVILLSLKCLGFLLKWDLPSIPEHKRKIGNSALKLLTVAGAMSNTRQETTQGCFKIMTLLMSLDEKSATNMTKEVNDSSTNVDQLNAEGVNVSHTNAALPLSSAQMQALVSILHGAITDSVHHNATFSLVKAIASTRYMSVEYYDMMETILKLSVQSQKDTVRQQSSHIFMQFLIDYPLGKKKLEDHLKQIILNIKYEYEEGRLSAIGLLLIVIQKLPIPLLEEHMQLFFLPLVLQLVNDDSKQCRERVAECITWIMKRVSGEKLLSLYEYISRWFGVSGDEALPLQRTGAQIMGIMVDSRPDYVSKGNMAAEFINMLQDTMNKEIQNPAEERWELLYFCLLCFEKLTKALSDGASKYHSIWVFVLQSMIHSHPWVKRISSRIINDHVSVLNPLTFITTKEGESQSFITTIPGSLYDIARNLCYQINVEDEEQNDETITLAVKTFSWLVSAMHHHPDLCYRSENLCYRPENDINDEKEETVQIQSSSDPESTKKSPTIWLMNRLSNIAKGKGRIREEAVFKTFAAFSASCDAEILSPHLEIMLEPLHRSIFEAESKANHSLKDDDAILLTADLPKDVMRLLEDHCGTDTFLSAYVVVKEKARVKRNKRKLEITTELVKDPEAAAKRKLAKQEKKKLRTRRKMDEKRSFRGATRKKSRYHGPDF